MPQSGVPGQGGPVGSEEASVSDLRVVWSPPMKYCLDTQWFAIRANPDSDQQWTIFSPGSGAVVGLASDFAVSGSGWVAAFAALDSVDAVDGER